MWSTRFINWPCIFFSKIMSMLFPFEGINDIDNNNYHSWRLRVAIHSAWDLGRGRSLLLSMFLSNYHWDVCYSGDSEFCGHCWEVRHNTSPQHSGFMFDRAGRDLSFNPRLTPRTRAAMDAQGHLPCRSVLYGLIANFSPSQTPRMIFLSFLLKFEVQVLGFVTIKQRVRLW
jgi:hypothetical protein